MGSSNENQWQSMGVKENQKRKTDKNRWEPMRPNKKPLELHEMKIHGYQRTTMKIKRNPINERKSMKFYRINEDLQKLMRNFNIWSARGFQWLQWTSKFHLDSMGLNGCNYSSMNVHEFPRVPPELAKYFLDLFWVLLQGPYYGNAIHGLKNKEMCPL